MKLIYYLSYALYGPFLMLAVLFNGAGWCFMELAGLIHDATTYKAWHVLHMRAIKAKQQSIDPSWP
jgi:hypothetical protein